MKPAYLIFFVLLLCKHLSLKSQYYFSTGNHQEPVPLWEMGLSAGAINCLTDIGGHSGIGKKFIKDINWNKTQACMDAFVSATWPSGFSIRAAFMYGQITGSDDVLKNSSSLAQARYLRNLSFKTSILEGSILAEIHPLAIFAANKEVTLLSPYCIAGIGLFNYNPQAFINNAWVDLRALHTEGEGFAEVPNNKTYSPVSWCIPLGAGIKYDASGLINLRFELLYRITGTDYLDDLSNRYIDPSLFSKYLSATQAALAIQLADRSAELANGKKNNVNDIRGNPSNKDAYFSAMLKISLALGRK
ncbi:MAG: DUF6089 family protein [Chitinophagaceae bacterium]